MDLKTIENAVIKAIQQSLNYSEKDCGNLRPETSPMKDLNDFDSMNGVESSMMIGIELNREIPLENLFVKNNTPLTIREIAVGLKTLIDNDER